MPLISSDLCPSLVTEGRIPFLLSEGWPLLIAVPDDLGKALVF